MSEFVNEFESDTAKAITRGRGNDDGALAGERFTVVIPTRNRPLGVTAMLRYLRMDLRWSCPVVVVDQSDDGGAALARALEVEGVAEVVLVRQRERGTGVARNAGARLAATEWLLLLDDDVRPALGYLESIAAYIDANPWLDAVQPGLEQRTAWEEYTRDPAGWLERRAAQPHERAAPTPAWDGVRWFTNSPRTGYGALTVGVASGNLAISRRAFEGVGGFDEQIEGRGDDSEFGVRLWWYGYRVCILPQPVAFHLREPHGGTRQATSRWQRLLAPAPPVGWVYFHLKWFPGTPLGAMRREYLRGAWRRPWTLPVRLLRFRRSLAAARIRLASGPRYLSPPAPRDSTHTADDASRPVAVTAS
jgi:GT2 family glycosyltransferase